MSGYTPLFASTFDGSLCGRWPAAAVWCSLLALCNKHGEIDLNYQAIAGRTGWPLDLLRQGIEGLMQPDPESRSPAEDGRRLVLLDPERSWGWRIVNHAMYREKARLAAKSAREVESGHNRGRMIERTAGDRRSPPPTAADPLSDSDSDSNANKRIQIRAQEGTPGPQGYRSKELHLKVIDSYHGRCRELPRVKRWSARRDGMLTARIAERLKAGKPADTEKYWNGFFDKVAASDFLCGRKTDWRAPGLEWLLKEANFLKIIEGNYDNHGGSCASGGPTHATH